MNGYGVKKDYLTAIKWYKKAAASGDSEALSNLGFMYVKGFGVKQDYEKAVKLAEYLNDENKVTYYKVKCEQNVYVAKITVPENYSTAYKSGTYKITAEKDGVKYSSAENKIVTDVSIFEYVNIHDYIDDVDALPPSFEEGTDVEMEIILSTDEYFVYWLSIEEDQDWNSFATEDGVNYTLSDLPDENITVTIYIAPAE